MYMYVVGEREAGRERREGGREGGRGGKQYMYVT